MDQSFKENFIVVLSAGGEGSRFRTVSGSNGLQKAAYVLPNGDSMIERTVKLYRDIGLKNFVVLVYHNADSIKERLGDGSKLGVLINYSHDPEKPVGRGGAVKHALNQGFLSRDSYLIVHNPDDQLVGDPSTLIEDAIDAHIEYEKKGAVATAILAEGTPYEFTGFEIHDGFVTHVEMYPFVKIPTHIGMTIFSPAVSKYFDELFNLEEKKDFESVLFPVLKEEGKLAAHTIPPGTWISVNDEKGLKKLLKALNLERP